MTVNLISQKLSLSLLGLALAAAFSLGLSGCKDSVSAPPEVAEAILQGDQLMFPQGHPQLRLLKLSKAVSTEAVDLPMSAKLSWNEEAHPAFVSRLCWPGRAHHWPTWVKASRPVPCWLRSPHQTLARPRPTVQKPMPMLRWPTSS